MDHCEEYLELISASLDGALSPAEREKLEAHLAACPECQALALELKSVHEVLAGLPAAQPPAELHDRIMAAVAADNVTVLPVKKAPSVQWRRWGSLAAAAALVLAGAWGLFRSGGATKESLPQSPDIVMSRKANVSSAESVPETTVQALEPVRETDEPAMMADPEIIQESNSDSDGETDGSAAPVEVSPQGASSTDAAQPAPTAAATEAPASDLASSVTGAAAPSDDEAGETPTQASAPQTETVPAPTEEPVSDDAVFITSMAATSFTARPEPPVPMPEPTDLPNDSTEAESIDEEPLYEAKVVMSEANAPEPWEDAFARLLAEKGFSGCTLEGDHALWPREGDIQEHIAYCGLSDNGLYYLFEFSRTVWDGEDSAHVSRCALYAVPVDGGDILEGPGPEFQALMEQ